MSVVAEEASEQTDRRWRVVVVLAVVGALAFAWFLVLHHWSLNSDGSGYGSIGFNATRGRWWTLPDGSPTSSFRGPLYPLMLVAPWRHVPDFATSIWISRLPLMVGPIAVAAAVWFHVRRLDAAFVAGAVAIAQPWSLLAGGSLFVPDGTWGTATVIAVLSASMIFDDSRVRAGWVWATVAAVVVAVAAKETGLVAVPLVGLQLWVGRRRPRLPARMLSLLGAAVAVFIALIVGAGSIDGSLTTVPSRFVDRVQFEAYPNSAWWIPAALVATAFVVWALAWLADVLTYAGLLLVSSGLSMGFYAGARGYGIRNAVLLPYGLALVVGAVVAAVRSVRWGHVTALAAALVLVVSGVGGSVARADESRSWIGWNNPPVVEGARWLGAHARGHAIGCTLLYCSYTWLANHGQLDLRLLPQFGARIGADRLDRLSFDELAGWSGRVPVSPVAGTHRPLVLSRSDELFGAVFEDELLASVRRQHLRYLVVSGSVAGNSTFDAGRLVPYLNSNPAFRLVFASRPEALPAFELIYEVVKDPRPIRHPRMILSGTARDALRSDPTTTGARVLDGTSYARLIASQREKLAGAGRR